MQHPPSVILHEPDYPEFDFRSLRYTHAAILTEHDVLPKFLQERLGHKDLQITMKYYLHPTDQMGSKGPEILMNMYQRKAPNQ